MTRRDFVAIAEILKTNNADPKIVFDFCDYFIKVNPRFSKARFLAAVFDNEDYGKVIRELGGDVR